MRSAASDCNLENNQIMVDPLLAFGTNWLLYAFSDGAGPWSVDASDRAREWVSRGRMWAAGTHSEIQYN